MPQTVTGIDARDCAMGGGGGENYGILGLFFFLSNLKTPVRVPGAHAQNNGPEIFECKLCSEKGKKSARTKVMHLGHFPGSRD